MLTGCCSKSLPSKNANIWLRFNWIYRLHLLYHVFPRGISNILGNSVAVKGCWVYSPASLIGFWGWSLIFLCRGECVGECLGHGKGRSLWETGIWSIPRYFKLIFSASYLKKTVIIIFIRLVLWELRQKHRMNNFRKWLFFKFKISCFFSIHFRVQRI